MALENELCILPEGVSLRCLQQTDDDNFVWVHQADLAHGYGTISPHTRQEEHYERATECVDVTRENKNQIGIVESTLMSDIIEDFSHDQYRDFEPIVIRDRKSTKQRHRRRLVSSSKTINNSEDDELVHSALQTFDGATTEILKSIVASNNYYRGLLGKFISKETNSVVMHAWIYYKTYPLWHPDAKRDFFRYNRILKMWRLEENAVKVYKLSENAANNEKIFQQVCKEKEHLLLLCRAKCNVPQVKRCSRNVIVTGFVGEERVPAPSIATLPLKLSQETYHIIVKDMEMWYKTLHLVHGKLSTTNILYWNKRVHYIGWSHSVKTDHSLALKKLMKDCLFITKFFQARSVSVKSTEHLFKDVTGLDEINKSVLSMIHSVDLWKSQHLANPNRMTSRHESIPGRRCRFK